MENLGLGRPDFAQWVEDAIDGLPPDLRSAISNVARRVVVHEIAHHFGISDERLRELDCY